MQIFTKNNNQWKAKPLTDDDVTRFQNSLSVRRIRHPISHDSYLINLASPDDELRQKSIDAMVVELERAHALGIANVVAHPGAHMGEGEEAGLERIVASLNTVFERTSALPTKIALETTAGQGSTLGYKFEHLGTLIKQTKKADRLTVCLDTCHIFAAGYPLKTKAEYQQTMKSFDQLVGVDRLVAFHINDSKKDLGTRVDRHEHIGLGCLGIEPFRYLLNDKKFDSIPMYLETEKPSTMKTGEEWGHDQPSLLKSLCTK